MDQRIIPKKKYSWFEIVIAVLILVFFFAGFVFSRKGTTYWGSRFIFGIFVLVVVYAIYAEWTWRQVWNKLAQEIGLDIHLGPFVKNPYSPRLTGYYRGYSIKVDRIHVGWDKRRMYTRIQVALTTSTANHRFCVETIDWITRFKRKRNLQASKGLFYTEMGDTGLDRSLFFQSHPTKFVHEVFQPAKVRQGLVEIASRVEVMNLALFSNRLRYYETGQMYDVAYLKSIIDWLIEITQQIERVANQKP